MKGRITSLKHDKGFGFIKDEQQVDRFFHASRVEPPPLFTSLRVGDEVEFDPEEDPTRGHRAVLVRRA